VYIDLIQYIEDTKARLGKDSKTYKALVQAFTDHEGLRAHLEGRVRLCSSWVNPFVDEMDIDRGQDIYVRPFVNDKGAVIHSDPPFFFVGSRNSHGFGVKPAEGWEDMMESHEINSDLVKKVRDFLRANVPYDP